jgi:hypothetical protein
VPSGIPSATTSAACSAINSGHQDTLLACLRAGGVSAACVAAAALDARGLTRLAVDQSGVSRFRLAFPQPVVTLDDLPAGLRVVLQPRCGCCEHGSATR